MESFLGNSAIWSMLGDASSKPPTATHTQHSSKCLPSSRRPPRSPAPAWCATHLALHVHVEHHAHTHARCVRAHAPLAHPLRARATLSRAHSLIHCPRVQASRASAPLAEASRVRACHPRAQFAAPHIARTSPAQQVGSLCQAHKASRLPTRRDRRFLRGMGCIAPRLSSPLGWHSFVCHQDKAMAPLHLRHNNCRLDKLCKSRCP